MSSEPAEETKTHRVSSSCTYTFIWVKNYKTCCCFLSIILPYRLFVYFFPEKERNRSTLLQFYLCVLPFRFFIQPVCRHETYSEAHATTWRTNATVFNLLQSVTVTW